MNHPPEGGRHDNFPSSGSSANQKNPPNPSKICMLLDTYMFLKLTGAKTLVPASKYAIPKEAYKVDRDGSIVFWVVSNLRIHFDPQTI